MLLTVVSKTDSVVQFLTVLVIFVLVLGATWLTTRYIAGFQKGKMRGSNFEMIDSYRISQNKFIQILRIGDRYLAVAVCKDTVTVLTELTEEEIVRPESQNAGTAMQFDEILKKAKGLAKKTDTKAADVHEKKN